MKPEDTGWTGRNGAAPEDDQRGIVTGYRRVRRTGKPSVSVVLAMRSLDSDEVAPLRALVERCRELGAEPVVVGAGRRDSIRALEQLFPMIRVVPCDIGTPLHEQRRRGMREAEGDIVAFVEDAADLEERLATLDFESRRRGAVPGRNGTRGAGEEPLPPDLVSALDEMTAPPPGPRPIDRLKPGDHVVVIGAGPGGLTAAYLLAKKGVRVTVLEGDDMVGGISRTAQYKGYRFDIGGHRFFTKIKPVEDLWNEILPDDFISVPRLSRIHYDGKFFDYPLRAWNALSGMGLWRALQMVGSYIYAHIRPSPVEENLEQWVTNRFGRRLYEVFFKTYTEKVWGIPCTEIRAEWAAQRIQNLSLAKAILSAASLNKRSTKIKTLIHEFRYPRLGPGQMWEVCTAKIEQMGGRVLMRHYVDGLEMENGRVIAVRVNTPDGMIRIEGDHFISTMPVRTLVRSLVPAVPAEVAAAADGLKYRDFLQVALILDKEDLFPDNWIYIHTPGVKVGRIQNFNNWSRAMVPDPGRTCLGMEYFCFEGDGLWTSSDQDLIALATAELEQLGLANGANVVDGTVVRMPKAYPVYDSVYREHLATIRKHIDAIPNLHEVGRNGMHKYNNQDHSMLTAMMVVWNLEGADHDVWAVNTDFEYHEEQRLESPKPEGAAVAAG